MRPWRALLVDDEPPARRRLRRLLGPHDRVTVVAEAGSVAEARAAIEATPVDVVFLDVHLGGGEDDAFALFDEPLDPEVVFVTAYDAHALAAFEAGAMDYLLKPVDPERLDATIARLARRQSLPVTADDRVVCLPLHPAMRFVRMGDIACVRARGDYTEVHLGDGSEELVAIPLHRWRARLPEATYAQVHRGVILRLSWLERLEPRGSAWVAHVRHVADAVPVSRRHLDVLRRRLRDVSRAP
ncbi:MAG: LytTR family DNA-binding domain-containing protein [Myxococcota bacterium]